MASILNADTSNGLKITSDTSGEIKLQSAGTDVATVTSSGVSAKTFTPTSSTTPTNGLYLPVTNTISISTNSTERMRIDSSGYVTEPNKPMAFAVSTPDVGTSPGSPVVLKYANAAYNPGSHYNATTGLFTCPVEGRYKVTQHCMVNASLTTYPLNVSINKNGGGVTTGYTSNTTYNINTCMAIISCAANDTLSATLNHGGKHAGYDSFTVEFLG